MIRMLVASVLLTLAACGEEAPEDNEGATTFACENTTCDSATGEFCWFQRYANGESHSATCVAPTTACETCECAEEAVQAELDGSNNCSGLTSCSQDGAAITFTCDNPSF